MSSYFDLRKRTAEDALRLTVQDQYDLASKLAANCGYMIVPEDNERSLEIKTLIRKHNALQGDDWELIVEGLKGLLK